MSMHARARAQHPQSFNYILQEIMFLKATIILSTQQEKMVSFQGFKIDILQEIFSLQYAPIRGKSIFFFF